MARKAKGQSHETKEKIIEVATVLFGRKGFEGTTTRDIARTAKVNVATLNYHFKSKRNLLHEVLRTSLLDCKSRAKKMLEVPNQTVEGYCLGFYDSLLECDGDKLLGQYKVFLSDAKMPKDILSPYPPGHEELLYLLKKELKCPVSEELMVWAVRIIFSFLIKTAVMSVTPFGRKHAPELFIPDQIQWSIKELVKVMIQRLNQDST